MADPLAVYGAVTATVALLFAAIGAYNQLRDRPWLRLRFRIVPARHGFVSPGLKHVISDISNVGRRRALIYPPLLRYINRARKELAAGSPAEKWEDGAAWIPIDDTGDPPILVQLDEFATTTYLHHLDAGNRVIRLDVHDSLNRRRSRYARFGRLFLLQWRLRTSLTRWRSRAPNSAA